MNRPRTLTAIMALFVASGCVGTDVGNPQTNTPSELEFVVPVVQTSTKALVSEDWTIQTLEVYIDSLTGVATGGSNPDIVLVNGPVKIDLVGLATPLEFETNVDTVQQLGVVFEREAAPWLEAEFISPDGRMIFIEASNTNRIRYKGEIPLDQGLLFSTHPVLPWLVQKADSLAALANNTTISETNEPQLFRSFLKAFAPDAKLYLDKDKNSKFDEQDLKIGTPAP